MRNTWMLTLQEWNFLQLRWGLGYITEEEVRARLKLCNLVFGDGSLPICKKLYTTRKKPMHGEYQVVTGSYIKAKPVDPPIRFVVNTMYTLNLRTGDIWSPEKFPNWTYHETISFLNRDGRTFAELDLGIPGTLFSTLRDELLKLNKKYGVTENTPMYINVLEPMK
uniref:Uncharacterized protein n=1 Tax=viral metagenome TaxID=1070528 RepID=A0A6M3LWR9_9ZZZZ